MLGKLPIVIHVTAVKTMSADADRLLKRRPVSKKYNIVQKRSYVEPNYVAVKETYPDVCVEILRDLLPINFCVIAGRSVE